MKITKAFNKPEPQGEGALRKDFNQAKLEKDKPSLCLSLALSIEVTLEEVLALAAVL